MKVKHELNKRQEKRTWFGKLEIMKMSAVWLVITLSVTAMLFIASRLSAKAVENQRKITEKTIRCVGLAEEIQSGSDILTNAVWRFAATGKTRYAREYLEEKTETLTRDKAIEGLRKEGLLEEELETIELAKSVSDNLMEQELHCIRLIYEAEGIQYFPEEISEVELTHTEKKMTSEDKRKKANQFVFGSRYEATKDVIKENINLFTSEEGACAGYEENRFFSTSTAGDGHHASDLVPGFHGILLYGFNPSDSLQLHGIESLQK